MAKRDPAFMRLIGSKGGKKTAKEMGSDHMRKIGKRGLKKRWAKIKV